MRNFIYLGSRHIRIIPTIIAVTMAIFCTIFVIQQLDNLIDLDRFYVFKNLPFRTNDYSGYIATGVFFASLVAFEYVFFNIAKFISIYFEKYDILKFDPETKMIEVPKKYYWSKNEFVKIPISGISQVKSDSSFAISSSHIELEYKDVEGNLSNVRIVSSFFENKKMYNEYVDLIQNNRPKAY